MRFTCVVSTACCILLCSSFLLFAQTDFNDIADLTYPDSVITIVSIDGIDYRYSEKSQVREIPVAASLAAICEGRWTGTNQISFKVVNQTRIDTFKIVLTNVGGCSQVTLKTMPVNINSKSFTINYNIPTISAGSVTGTFA